MRKALTSLLLLVSLAGCRNLGVYTYKDLKAAARSSYESAKIEHEEKKQELMEKVGEAYRELLLERTLDFTNIAILCSAMAESYEKAGDEKTAKEYWLKRDIYRMKIGIIERQFKKIKK